MNGIGKGVVTLFPQMALWASLAVLGATITPRQPIATSYHTTSSPLHPLIPPSGLTLPEGGRLERQGASEPSLGALGSKQKKIAVRCIRRGGNYYYRGHPLCLYSWT